MKSSLLSFVLFSAIVSAAETDPPMAASAPTGNAVRHEDIVELRRKAREKSAQSTAKPATADTLDPSKTNKPASLMSRSEILCFEGIATLVPKRAIINKPTALEARLALSDGARLTAWSEFYEANRGWIKTIEVTRKQAEGKEPFPEETVKMLEGSSAVVVATFHGAPISVLPLKVVAPTQPESSTSPKP